MVRKTILSAGLIAAAGMLAGAGAANASIYPDVVSVSNLASGTYSVGAYQATITFNVSQIGALGSGDYSLAITLDNTSEMVNPTNLLKGVQFTLGSGTVDTSVSKIGLSGYEETLTTSDKKITGYSETPAPLVDSLLGTGDWWASGSSGTYNFVGNQGAYLVISSPGSSANDPYPYATNGLAMAGSKGLSPFLANNPTFVLGITDAKGLPAVALNEVYFGTGTLGDLGVPVNTLIPVPAGGPLPIPATLPLAGGGLLGLGLIALRKRRRLPQSR